ncbi:MAG TPA: hypothetical protein VL551_06065 [Actinospica sp.]|nr:hypothetical protein [Actinospica sp.]
MVIDFGDESVQAGSCTTFTYVVLSLELPSLLLLLLGSMPGPSSGPAAIDAQPGLELACRVLLALVPASVLVVAARRRYWVAGLIQVAVMIAALILA